MKKIIIVESPGKIQSIQKYVGGNYKVYASYGQIVDLAKGGRFGIGTNPLNNFKPFYCLIPEKINFLDKIISDVDNIDEIIIATDPDTEGHGIAWHIGKKLEHLHKPIKRAEFHEITKEGIEQGFKNICDLDFNKFKAQETRRILDRIVGFMVSPFLINFYGEKLSAGRVQSVATKMIIERENKIKSFTPEEYWNLTACLTKNTLKLNAKYVGKIKNEEQANSMRSILESPSIDKSVFTVNKVTRKPKKEEPPPPLTTAKMQQIMASRFGMEGEATMAAAQNLYELGLITYMRTDSVRISDIALNSARSWLSKNNFAIPSKPNFFKNKDAAQNAHECIRPTNIETLPKDINLSPEQNKLYDVIWKMFVSSQMAPAIYDTLNIQVQHASGNKFKVSGKSLVQPGYLGIFGKLEATEELPNINEGDVLKLDHIVTEQKFTQPPTRYTYASLIKELDNRGIGRPSTFSSIINIILNRGYVAKDSDNNYYGTQLGENINQILIKYFDFLNYDYTSNLEQEIDDIASGNKNYLDVLNKFYDLLKCNLQSLALNFNYKICSKCGTPMYFCSYNDISYYKCSLDPFCKNSKIYINKLSNNIVS